MNKVDIDDKYTEKHKALANYLKYLDISRIENEDDMNFLAYKNYYWVLDKDEAWEMVYDEVVDMLDSPESSFYVKDVLAVLNVDKEVIKDFFLADVLTGKFKLGTDIDGESTLKFVNHVTNCITFAKDFTNFIFTNNRSGELLDFDMNNIMEDGFYIYRR